MKKDLPALAGISSGCDHHRTNLAVVARRFSNIGMTTAEIAVRMDVREEYIHEWLTNTVLIPVKNPML
jgi:hypothetical protein